MAVRAIGRLRAGGRSDAYIRSLLWPAGEQGFWYDPSDLNTQYVDSAGTTPVTAVGQAVGLVLDKSRGLALGTERVTNGGFDADASWTKGTGWTIGGGVATKAAGTGSSLQQAITASATASYRITFDATRTAGFCFVRVGSTGYNPFSISASGTYSITIPAGGADGNLYFFGDATFAGTIDNITCKEIPGNHLLQATSGSRPFERLDTNYAHETDGLDDSLSATTGGGGTTGFFFCAAVKPATDGFLRTLWSDVGANTGYRVRLTAANKLELAAGNGVGYTTATSTDSVLAGTKYVVTAWHDGTNLRVQVNQATAVAAAFGTATAGTAAISVFKDNGAATSFHDGYTYQAVYRKDTAPDAASIAAIQRFVASKAGIAI